MIENRSVPALEGNFLAGWLNTGLSALLIGQKRDAAQ
jgi:hypothetical protein